jgi:hypothetical protein
MLEILYIQLMKSNISLKIADILTKDLSYAEFASATLKKEMKIFEKKYSMNWKDFLNKFEKGELGDDRIWFDWYNLAISTKNWDDTKSEIKKILATA